MVRHLAAMPQSRVRNRLLLGQRQTLSIPWWFATWDGTVPVRNSAVLKNSSQRGL